MYCRGPLALLHQKIRRNDRKEVLKLLLLFSNIGELRLLLGKTFVLFYYKMFNFIRLLLLYCIIRCYWFCVPIYNFIFSLVDELSPTNEDFLYLLNQRASQTTSDSDNVLCIWCSAVLGDRQSRPCITWDSLAGRNCIDFYLATHTALARCGKIMHIFVWILVSFYDYL